MLGVATPRVALNAEDSPPAQFDGRTTELVPEVNETTVESTSGEASPCFVVVDLPTFDTGGGDTKRVFNAAD
jgi:hypothetical protein